MSGRPARVLIVEDEPDLASGVRDNLRADGYEAEVAADGETGLARALQEPWDLVLLDVMLPDLDGFELCRRLRAAGNEVAVLFLTARDDPEDRIRGLEEGGDDYLTKPFRLQELLLRVRAIRRPPCGAVAGTASARPRACASAPTRWICCAIRRADTTAVATASRTRRR